MSVQQVKSSNGKHTLGDYETPQAIGDNQSGSIVLDLADVSNKKTITVTFTGTVAASTTLQLPVDAPQNVVVTAIFENPVNVPALHSSYRKLGSMPTSPGPNGLLYQIKRVGLRFYISGSQVD